MSTILEYAKFLEHAGTEIVNISRSLKEEAEIPPSGNAGDLKEKIQRIDNNLVQYTLVRNRAASFIPPEHIKNEHLELVDALDEFLEGTKLQFESINIANDSYDNEKYQKGFAKQAISEARTENVLKRIVGKFTN
ncbi:hypothetical protein P9847_18645 [Paenibacillus chibensis]|uniref:Uncharacterized protein n=1 Tax=Paenibacillus chibensis TaxID=59846 RepID=A0ABU6PYD1_9BACL|nr:hypothetical protein [Paenibacillus chibensis]